VRAEPLAARRSAAVIAVAALAGIGPAVDGAAASVEAGTPLPEAVALPTPVACSFHDSEGGGLILELSPGVPYAYVGDAKVDVTLPVASRPVPVGVTVAARGVRLRGVAPAAKFPLRLTRPFVVDEIFAPTDSAELPWTDARVGSVGVEIVFPSDAPIRVLDVKGTLRFRRSCDQIGIGFSTFATLPDRWSDGDKRNLRLSQSVLIPVSATRAGPAVAKLVVMDASYSEVQPLERDEQWSRIAARVGAIDVIGWVRNEWLRGMWGLYNSDNRFVKYLEPRRKPDQFLFSCNAELPLVAEAGGKRRTVGTVAPGVVMLAAPTEDEYVAVRFTKAPVRPMDKARLLVRQSDVKGCAGFRSP